MSDRARKLWIAFSLALVTVLVYARVGRHEFVSYDDNDYVYANPHVLAGLSWEGVCWAFTDFHAANWHPLTWLSHMLDVEIFELDSGRHHLINVVFHALNAVVCFLALRTMTQRIWPSAFAAALFALHPLRVESVAWVAERKDVLAGTFWMLALLAYAGYGRAPTRARYAAVAACFALGLLAKPMVLTLPVVLWLLDFWPLGRWALEPRPAAAGAAAIPPPEPSPAPTHPGKASSRTLGAGSGRRLLVEKLPLLALSLACAWITLLTQSSAGSTSALGALPLPLRVLNAFASVTTYLTKTLVPVRLAVFYPHAALVEAHPLAALAPPAAIGAVLAIGGIVLGLAWSRTRPYLLVGWTWFLITLLPVIGLVQAGTQAHADRYTYLPSVGLALLFAFGLAELARARPALRGSIIGFAVLVLGALAVVSVRQVGVWRDSDALFEHALLVTERNYLAHEKLGELAQSRGELDRAEDQFKRVLAIQPTFVKALHNLVLIALERGDPARAAKLADRAVAIDPHDPATLATRALVALESGDLDDARERLRALLVLDPGNADAHFNLGIAAQRGGDLRAAEEHYRDALVVAPDHGGALNNMGQVLLARGASAEAARFFERLCAVEPYDPGAHFNLGVALRARGSGADAGLAFRRALELDPTFAPAAEALEELGEQH